MRHGRVAATLWLLPGVAWAQGIGGTGGLEAPLPPRVLLWIFAGVICVAGMAWALGDARRAASWMSLLPPEVGELALAALRSVRRLFVLLAGLTLLAVGAALMLLPGPGTLVMLAGLALLATEFLWARVWIRRLRGSLENLGRSARGWLGGDDDDESHRQHGHSGSTPGDGSRGAR